MEIEGVISTTS